MSIYFKVDKEKFRFTYLQDYAAYLMNEKLTEFVTVGIRFSREANLPILKALDRFPEEELVKLGTESNRQMLQALATNEIAAHIEKKSETWINNTMSDIVDRHDVTAEDLTLGYYIRRRIFAHFLDAYTKNVVLQKFIIAEVDMYTSQEELVSCGIYLGLQKEKLNSMNSELLFHKELLLEAQELGGMGSFLINFRDSGKNVFTPEYQKILDIEDRVDFATFFSWVHPEDREELRRTVENAYTQGGRFEVQYRYCKTPVEKRIWSRGFVLTENGHPILIRGIIREMKSGPKEKALSSGKTASRPPAQ